MERQELERRIGAVLVPEVRVPGTYGTHPGCTPPDDYLHRFPPAAVIAFGRTPAGPRSPRARLDDLRARCVALGLEPPIAACDLEQGAGLHFEEGTLLPPALALAAAAKGHGDTGQGLNWVRSAGYVTGAEARELGIELVLAPVADVNTKRDNPIIAVRSFGDEPGPAAARAVAFLEGLHMAGAGGCAKHFPGHGDTALDSHTVLPRIDRDQRELREVELEPFRALVRAEADAILVAHLDVPALTRRPGTPTSLSRHAVQLLRDDLGFRGAVLSDALNMGALERIEGRYVKALAAGIDGLLCPGDPFEAALEISRAVRTGELEEERLYRAARAMLDLRERLATKGRDLHVTGVHRSFRGAPVGPVPRRTFAATAADRALCLSGSVEEWRDAGGWPARLAFLDERPSAEAAALLEGFGGDDPGAAGLLLLVPSEVAAGSGRYGLDGARRADLEARIDGLLSEGLRVGLVWFASPQTLPRTWWERPDLPVLVAFAPTPPMVQAVRRFLRGEASATGSLPAAPG